MKKTITLFAAIFCAIMSYGQSYGILVNGHTYYEATYKGPDAYGEGFEEYLAHVQVSAGDYCQLYDANAEAAWAVTLNPASEAGFTLNGDRYSVTVDGCYDFYIKLKYQADELYIGPGSNCGDGEVIGGGGGGDPQPGTGSKDYFLKGWCNDKDIETPTADEQFEHGTLTYTYTGDANFHMGYFFILVCDKGQVIGEEYLCTEYTTGVTHAKMVKGGTQKFGVPEGTVTFYLYDNEDGTYELSTVELPDKKLVDSDDDEPGQNALNEVVAADSNAPMYNLLGVKVDATYKGVVIQNGKKFILR